MKPQSKPQNNGIKSIMDRKKILIVDDEPDICNILKFNLDTAGYSTSVAHSAEEALTRGIVGYDLLLLDVMMDGISGLQMAKVIRNNPETASIPIIFVTAKDTEDDMIDGFEIGADDYISKPFSIREVLSRVQAVLRRSGKSGKPEEEKEDNIISFEDLVVDMGRKAVTVDGKSVDLTKTELELLHLLLAHPSTVYSRDNILSQVWPDEVVVLGRTVDVNITRLRKKLGRYGVCIVTRHGYGYCFEEHAHVSGE